MPRSSASSLVRRAAASSGIRPIQSISGAVTIAVSPCASSRKKPTAPVANSPDGIPRFAAIRPSGLSMVPITAAATIGSSTARARSRNAPNMMRKMPTVATCDARRQNVVGVTAGCGSEGSS